MYLIDYAKAHLKITLSTNKQIGDFYTFFYILHVIFQLLIFLFHFLKILSKDKMHGFLKKEFI